MPNTKIDHSPAATMLTKNASQMALPIWPAALPIRP
jgi:hypothetical protein